VLRVAVVGSGPAGIYAADALTRRGDVAVDVLDRLPCPYGLVRYGVAPDHLKIKSIATALHKVLDRPEVRFLGHVDVGSDVTVAELRDCYDAVVYAHGAAVDRRLGIPGEDLPGSFSATEFVAWYSGHPDTALDRFTLTAEAVVIIGVGNVAVDLARILGKEAGALRHTDLPDHVLEVLAASPVRRIVMVGRRGAAQAKFTTKELRELGEIPGLDVVVHPEELDSGAADGEPPGAPGAEDATVRRNLAVLADWAARAPAGAPRQLEVRFLLQPAEILGSTAVERVRFERTRLDGSGRAIGAGEFVELPAQMVFRSVGYQGLPLPGLPFDPAVGVVPNEQGRVLRDGAPSPKEYVAGWIKRGPTGVIGTNKSDAQETVTALLADLHGVGPTGASDPDALLHLLAARGVDVVTWSGWQSIDRAEMALGLPQGRDRVKIADLEGLLTAARAAASDPEVLAGRANT
jgi:ferredoxin--NADP+ reductase